jgi:type I restriction enzyme M protein
LLKQLDVHTLLRLPTGIFYKPGVKANVLFFDKKAGQPGVQVTSKLWVYDLRTGQHFTLKQNRLARQDLDDFVECYRPGEPRDSRIETERFRPFSYDELMIREKVSLDIAWLEDPSFEDAGGLLPPEVMAGEIVDDLTAALADFTVVVESLDQASSRYSAN